MMMQSKMTMTKLVIVILDGDENQAENDMTSISLGMMSSISRRMMTSKLLLTMTANVKSATKITFTNLMIMKINDDAENHNHHYLMINLC